jgi:hypothetical protein
MTAPPAGISEADWLATPSAVRGLILAQQEEIQQLRAQVCAMATELASLRERIGRTSRNSSKPPSSHGPGLKPPEPRKGDHHKRGGQPGHPGNGPECCRSSEWTSVQAPPGACRRCGTLLRGEDPDPLRHRVIEIPPLPSIVIEHRLHRMVCSCCSTSTCAPLPPDVEASRYRPKLSGRVGLLTGSFPLSCSKVQLASDRYAVQPPAHQPRPTPLSPSDPQFEGHRRAARR